MMPLSSIARNRMARYVSFLFKFNLCFAFVLASWNSLDMFANRSAFMRERIMWTDFRRYNESHFHRFSKNMKKNFIEPEIFDEDDRNVCLFCAHCNLLQSRCIEIHFNLISEYNQI